ncbi:MAG TPA: aminotransferase class III-fold pyridoxal phosphate-dependent enzyme [Polyangia bacterium]
MYDAGLMTVPLVGTRPSHVAQVSGELPGPRSRAICAREAGLLAPGVQRISTLSGLAFDGGEGALLYDADGNVFIDFVAGIGVASLGHGHPALAGALARQAARLSSGSYASESRARLLERIASVSARRGHPELCRTMLYSSGAEAVESALRLARAHTGHDEVIAFRGGFHGKTGGVLGLCGSDFKHGLGPFLPGQHLAPYPDRFRHPARDTAACLAELRDLLRLETGGRIAAILVEPIQGTAGNVIPPADFLPALGALAHELGALLIVDEMITGWGRTGRLFAVERSDVRPDILVFGKGVAAGYPVSGLITTDEIVARADPWSRPSSSSSSFGGSPLACAAADAVTEVIVDQRLEAHAAEVGRALYEALAPLAEKYPFVGEVRGEGLLIAVELVADRRTRAPLAQETCEWLFHECLRRGLVTMCYAPRVRINPPLVITREQALEGAAIFETALAALGERL